MSLEEKAYSTNGYRGFRLSGGGLFGWLYAGAGNGFAEKPGRLLLVMVLTVFPLICLTLIEGTFFGPELDQPLLKDVTILARFLVAVPLMLLSGVVVDSLTSEGIRNLRGSGLLDAAGKRGFDQCVDSFYNRKESVLPDLVLLVAIVSLSIVVLSSPEVLSHNDGISDWMFSSELEDASVSMAGYWCMLVSIPVLLLLLGRWFWRYVLWVAFLFDVSRLDLRYQATHPDLAGGLGVIKNSQSAFLLVFLSVSVLFAGALAEDILFAGVVFSDLHLVIMTFVGILLFAALLPLLFFAPGLIETKREGRVIYGLLGYRLSEAFAKKRSDPVDDKGGEKLLESTDPSSVCDYSDVYGAVRDMAVVPMSPKSVVTMAVVLGLPFIPLAMIGVSFSDFISKVVQSLI